MFLTIARDIYVHICPDISQHGPPLAGALNCKLRAALAVLWFPLNILQLVVLQWFQYNCNKWVYWEELQLKRSYIFMKYSEKYTVC